jgi:hypothetical protein
VEPLPHREGNGAYYFEIGMHPAQKNLKAYLTFLVRIGVKRAAFQKS